jgi:hypothetical protein
VTALTAATVARVLFGLCVWQPIEVGS